MIRVTAEVDYDEVMNQVTNEQIVEEVNIRCLRDNLVDEVDPSEMLDDFEWKLILTALRDHDIGTPEHELYENLRRELKL